jgi:hypothetical protein
LSQAERPAISSSGKNEVRTHFATMKGLLVTAV